MWRYRFPFRTRIERVTGTGSSLSASGPSAVCTWPHGNIVSYWANGGVARFTGTTGDTWSVRAVTLDSDFGSWTAAAVRTQIVNVTVVPDTL